MEFIRRHSLVLGLTTLIAVIVLLLSSSDLVFSSGVSFIDTDLQKASGKEVYVETKVDFGSPEHMANFPKEIGDWIGQDYDTSKWEELLGTEVMLMRGYTRSGYYGNPIYLLIMQAKTESSFHPPERCYRVAGYDIQEESREVVTLNKGPQSESKFPHPVPMKKLVVAKETNGVIRERRVVLFCYVKGNQFKTDTITMIRLESLAPITGSYEKTLNREKEFFAEAFPYMFDSGQRQDWHPIAMALIERGIPGYLAVLSIVSIPILILLLPRTKWGEHKQHGPHEG